MKDSKGVLSELSSLSPNGQTTLRLPSGREEVPTDDEEEEVPKNPKSDSTLQPRRVILLKRPNLPRGHSPGNMSEGPSQDTEESIVTITVSPSISCNCAESNEQQCHICFQPTGENVSRSSSRSVSLSRPSEPLPEPIKGTTLIQPQLTLEQREQAYEEARRRIFGSPSLESNINLTDIDPVAPPSIQHGQPRPLRPRPYRTPPIPSLMPGYPNAPFNPFQEAPNWALTAPLPNYCDTQNTEWFHEPLCAAPEFTQLNRFSQMVPHQPPPPPTFKQHHPVSFSPETVFNFDATYQRYWDPAMLPIPPGTNKQVPIAPLWRGISPPPPPYDPQQALIFSNNVNNSISNNNNTLLTVRPVHFVSSNVRKMEPRNISADLSDPDFNRNVERKSRSLEKDTRQATGSSLRTYDSDFPPLG